MNRAVGRRSRGAGPRYTAQAVSGSAGASPYLGMHLVHGENVGPGSWSGQVAIIAWSGSSRHPGSALLSYNTCAGCANSPPSARTRSQIPLLPGDQVVSYSAAPERCCHATPAVPSASPSGCDYAALSGLRLPVGVNCAWFVAGWLRGKESVMGVVDWNRRRPN